MRAAARSRAPTVVGRRAPAPPRGGVDADDDDAQAAVAASSSSSSAASLANWLRDNAVPLAVGAAVVGVFVATGARDYFESGFDSAAWAGAVGGGWRLARTTGGAVASFVALYALRDMFNAAAASVPTAGADRAGGRDPVGPVQLATQLWT